VNIWLRFRTRLPSSSSAICRTMAASTNFTMERWLWAAQDTSIRYAERPVELLRTRTDVAVVSHSRRIEAADNLQVLRNSSLKSNRRPTQSGSWPIQLRGASLQFWLVDLDRVTVTAIHRDGSTFVYVAGQFIPLAAFGGDTLPVDEIFG